MTMAVRVLNASDVVREDPPSFTLRTLARRYFATGNASIVVTDFAPERPQSRNDSTGVIRSGEFHGQ